MNRNVYETVDCDEEFVVEDVVVENVEDVGVPVDT